MRRVLLLTTYDIIVFTYFFIVEFREAEETAQWAVFEIQEWGLQFRVKVSYKKPGVKQPN